MSGEPYARYSRFTDPGSLAALLEALPASAVELCEIAERQTIHHNLFGYYGLDPVEARRLRRVWPPRMPDVLGALVEIEPGNLRDERTPEQRIVGACMLEAHFLAALLRSKGIPTRIRAGYFQGIRAEGEHIVRFWRGALRARGMNSDLFESDPDRWGETVDAVSRSRNAADHHIEHWVCEYREAGSGTWRLLDANRSFLKAHSNLHVGFHLPAAYFEHASRAWRKMRSAATFDPQRYVEEPHDGRSHIRSQLLWDFYSLLNHDLAGVGESDETLSFVKQQTYEASPQEELAALDALAELLETDPEVDRLTAFYFANDPLRIVDVEADPYSFVFTG